MDPFAGDEVLPCGRLLSRAWEHARDASLLSMAAKVLWRAADAVPGARAAACRFAPQGEGTGVRATMTLAATADRPLPETVHAVRRSVLHVAGSGSPLVAVDITVVGLLDPQSPGRPGLCADRGPWWPPYRCPYSPLSLPGQPSRFTA